MPMPDVEMQHVTRIAVLHDVLVGGRSAEDAARTVLVRSDFVAGAIKELGVRAHGALADQALAVDERPQAVYGDRVRRVSELKKFSPPTRFPAPRPSSMRANSPSFPRARNWQFERFPRPSMAISRS